MARCPICKREAAPRRGNPAFPFCSERCKLIDLGKWLGGDYAIASKPEEEEDEAPPVPPSENDS
ncbi:MAG TPA: DNA gyrase inhibitor YacG [Myxococcales bacterium]|nr:DNA gyrase inhibitor YacG [Myxococcales bacterium]